MIPRILNATLYAGFFVLTFGAVCIGWEPDAPPAEIHSTTGGQ